MSKIVKGAVKGVKKIAHGAVKEFKKVANSTVGKVIIAAAVIYFGGVALGAWGNVGAAGAGTGVGAVGAGGVSSVAAGVGTQTAADVIAGAALDTSLSTIPALGATAGTTALQAAGSGALAGASAGAVNAGLMAGVGAPALVGAGTTAASTGLAGYANTALNFMKTNPLATTMAFQGISSALSPDEIDIMREREKIRRSRFDSLNDVGDLNIGFSKTPRSVLYDSSGTTPWHQRLTQAGG